MVIAYAIMYSWTIGKRIGFIDKVVVNMRKVMFDVDGVLADFVYSFTKLAAQHDYISKPYDTTTQPAWDFDGKLTHEQQAELWSEIIARSFWWRSLDSLVTPTEVNWINSIAERMEVVYCTNRVAKNPNAQTQTWLWLKDIGINRPNVIVTKRKGDVARALDIDYSIDDKIENVNCVHWIADTKPCRSYVLDRLYNKNGAAKNVRRVGTITDFLTDVEEGK